MNRGDFVRVARGYQDRKEHDFGLREGKSSNVDPSPKMSKVGQDYYTCLDPHCGRTLFNDGSKNGSGSASTTPCRY